MIATAIREALIISRPGILRVQLWTPELGKGLVQAVWEIPLCPKGGALGLPVPDWKGGVHEVLLTGNAVRPLTSPFSEPPSPAPPSSFQGPLPCQTPSSLLR